MQISSRKTVKTALLGGAVAVLGLAAIVVLPGARSDENPLTKNFVAEADQDNPHWGQGFDRGVDPFFSLVMEASGQQELNLKFEKTLRVKRGDTLMETLVDAGINRSEAYYAIDALSDTFNPRKIRTGQTVLVTLEKPAFSGKTEARLSKIVMPMDFGEEVVVNRQANDTFSAEKAQKTTRSLKMYAEGTIEDSLYLSALSEGVPLGVVSEVIRLFSFDVDFQREIWSGDQFKVYYERRMTPEGEAENTGKVLAATLVLRGKPLTFYRFEGADGKVDYYTADGKSARKMLMKTPIDGARLSSRFGNRKHPVLGYTRMHKGVDFAAITGTPIMAAGDGVVERASEYGSYGNYIRIRHNGTYKTAYAHLSGYAKGIRSGVRVKQGQIIGYVGATGRVTGAHLHYEILKDDTQINPLDLKMPKGDSLTGTNLVTLEAEVSEMAIETRLIQALFTPPIGPDKADEVVTIGD